MGRFLSSQESLLDNPRRAPHPSPPDLPGFFHLEPSPVLINPTLLWMLQGRDNRETMGPNLGFQSGKGHLISHPLNPPAQRGWNWGIGHAQLQGSPFTQNATWTPVHLHFAASDSTFYLCSPYPFRLLSNNKITGLRNGSFLGLYLLEKL